MTGARATSKLARGCANSFLTRYTSEFDPSLAKEWWALYRNGWTMHLAPYVGMREWPPGTDLAGDVDSGPVILGIGTAASALAISAARANGDEHFAIELERSADAVTSLGITGPLPTMVLAQAIRFEAKWHSSGQARP